MRLSEDEKQVSLQFGWMFSDGVENEPGAHSVAWTPSSDPKHSKNTMTRTTPQVGRITTRLQCEATSKRQTASSRRPSGQALRLSLGIML